MKALVLSGGGSKGPFHAGFCRRAIGELKTQYDILCGVSVGALIAVFLAQYKHGEEVEAAKALDDLFLNIENKDVWKRWFLVGKVAGLWESSLLNSKPLQKLVRSRLDVEKVKSSGKLLRLGAVSLTQGKYVVHSECSTDIASVALASAAFPGFLLPIKMLDQWWVDGGVQQVTPIKAAIDAGATEIDVVVTEPKDASFGIDRKPEALDVFLRSLELMTHHIAWVDVKYAERVNELVKAGKMPGKRVVKLRVACPDRVLNHDSLNFDPKEAKDIALAGYKAAVQLESLIIL